MGWAMYNNVGEAIRDSRLWLTHYFATSNMLVQMPEDDGCLVEDSGCVKHIFAAFQSGLMNLDAKEGRLVWSEVDTGNYAAFSTAERRAGFAFFPALTDEDIAEEEEFERKLADFEETGGKRELFIKNKEEYLRKESPFDETYNIEDRRQCLHCGSVFQIKDYKVVADVDMDYICCPHYPHCDGTIIDWVTTEEPVRVDECIQESLRTGTADSPEPVECITEILLENAKAECYLRAGEGVAVWCDENPPPNRYAMIVIKKSMAEHMSQYLDVVLKSKESLFIFDRIRPAVFVLNWPDDE